MAHIPSASWLVGCGPAVISRVVAPILPPLRGCSRRPVASEHINSLVR
jgi:hypothetical protein